MQAGKGKAEALGRKAKLATSYQELLDEFSSNDLKTVGNYTLGRLIGKGSFGKVYLATHKLTNGSKVVLKSAKKEDSNLAREIHHHRQFIHPHIARLYEVIVTESLVWLVLEYCPGDELYNYLLKHGRLEVEKAQKIFSQLVGAVSYVHQQSCVHRDLKLENILLDRHEDVKLVDFGFTREYEGKANYLQTFCGTICYSAPEMLKGEKYAGEKVDVWSLGVILYALLCGELPFDEDEDDATRRRILAEEPKYPDHLPADAVTLLKTLLSKRPLLRPTLPDILKHPFLSEHAPLQQAILVIQQPPPFATPLQKETLQRMRSAGINIDSVIESVISQRCDALAGWWALLIEKEERKHARRERKRKERDQEKRGSRRLSAASSRLERLATVGEEPGTSSYGELGEFMSRNRGRSQRRSGHFELRLEDFAGLRELGKVNGALSPDTEIPPTPIDKDSVRSISSSRHRPIPPPKEGLLRSARSRGSTLHLVTTSDALAVPTTTEDPPMPKQKVRRKPSSVIIAHWKNWRHWIVENTRRNKGPSKRGSHSTPNLNILDKISSNKDSKSSKTASPRPQTSKYPASNSSTNGTSAGLPKGVVANGFAVKGGSANPATEKSIPISPTTATTTSPRPPLQKKSASYKRQSLSPSPRTPRTTVRRSSLNTGLRGRKSTSSSVSSIRSMPHHHHSHSKASSTSSNGSVSTTMSKAFGSRSPHHSVKVLPAPPAPTSFPASLRLVRGAGLTLQAFNEGMPGGSGGAQPPGSPNPFSNSGHSVFAKRKKNIFKGPMLSIGNSGGNNRSNSGSHSRSASANGLGRVSGEVAIQEVDEDAVADEEAQAEAEAGPGPEIVAGSAIDDGDVEEVDSFYPIVQGPNEQIEEIYEDAEPTPTADGNFSGNEPPKLTT